MASFNRVSAYIIEISLLTLIAIATVLSAIQIPSPGTENDIAWGAGYTYEIATGTSLLAIKDPYLRYIPQVVALKSAAFFQPLSEQLALQVYVGYTLFVAGIVNPFLAYVYSKYHYGRRTAIVTLFLIGTVGIRDWFSVVPEIPGFILIRIPNTHETGWFAVSKALFGTPYFTTVLFHYTFAIPAVLGALFSYSVYRKSENLIYGILAGVCIGVAGSIQVIQGLIGAFIIGGHAVRQFDIADLILVATPALVISLPNLFIYQRHKQVWASQGAARISFSQSNIVLLVIAALALVIVVGILRRYTTVASWTNKTLEPVTITWISGSLLLFYLFTPLAGDWYRLLVSGILKFGVLIGVASWLSPRLSAIVTDESGQW